MANQSTTKVSNGMKQLAKNTRLQLDPFSKGAKPAPTTANLDQNRIPIPKDK